MCDLDHFKAYDDTHGHPAGDQALRAVATTLTEQLRTTDRVYRCGGEEFLVLLPEESLPGAAIALERVRSQLQTLAIKHSHAGSPDVLTMSIGLAGSSPQRRPPSSGLLAAADSALYQAKRDGRNRLTLADQ